jgi:para-nitrobenzyl esterase
MTDRPLEPQFAVTRQGRLQSALEDGVAVFRAVPYAAPPTGKRRFRPPEPHPGWDGIRDATAHGPVPPQNRSRLAIPMGDFARPQDEDCLTLTIWTPAADGKRRPVMVWYHGGAFVSGAGSLDWYSGASLAKHGDIVVVGVNYRLGILGFMHKPGLAPTNLGLRDQIAALDYVHANIADFGGDPDAITVAGQSAGGLSVMALLALPQTRKLFGRAIVQSSPFGRDLKTPEQAATIAAKTEEFLGIRNDAQWFEATPADILAAQMKTMLHYARFADVTPPYWPVADRELFGADIAAAALPAAAGRAVMVGYTRDESTAFFAKNEQVLKADDAAVEGRFRDYFGADARAAMAEYAARTGENTAVSLLSAMVGDAALAAKSLEFCDRLATAGSPAWVYRFDWAAPANPFRACHCIELPFMFDSLKHWDAPMLAGGDPVGMRALAAQMRDAWIAFVRNGDPNAVGVPHWPRYEQTARKTLLFDVPSRVEDDPAGRKRWRYWP